MFEEWDRGARLQHQPVAFGPEGINYHLPLPTRLFIIYLLAVCVVWLVRFSSMLRPVWASRGPLRSPANDGEFSFAWETCWNKVQSAKRLVLFTLLLTVLVTTIVFRTTFVVIAEQKLYSALALYVAIAEALKPFELGIFASALIYAVCSFYEGALQRTGSQNRLHQAAKNCSTKV